MAIALCCLVSVDYRGPCSSKKVFNRKDEASAVILARHSTTFTKLKLCFRSFTKMVAATVGSFAFKCQTRSTMGPPSRPVSLLFGLLLFFVVSSLNVEARIGDSTRGSKGESHRLSHFLYAFLPLETSMLVFH